MPQPIDGHRSRSHHFHSDFQPRRQPHSHTCPNMKGLKNNFKHQPNEIPTPIRDRLKGRITASESSCTTPLAQTRQATPTRKELLDRSTATSESSCTTPLAQTRQVALISKEQLAAVSCLEGKLGLFRMKNGRPSLLGTENLSLLVSNDQLSHLPDILGMLAKEKLLTALYPHATQSKTAKAEDPIWSLVSRALLCLYQAQCAEFNHKSK